MDLLCILKELQGIGIGKTAPAFYNSFVKVMREQSGSDLAALLLKSGTNLSVVSFSTPERDMEMAALVSDAAATALPSDGSDHDDSRSIYSAGVDKVAYITSLKPVFEALHSHIPVLNTDFPISRVGETGDMPDAAHSATILAVPFQQDHVIEGVLYLQTTADGGKFFKASPTELMILSAQIGIILAFACHTSNLEKTLDQRTYALAEANLNLLDEIEQRQQAENYIMHMAYHDALTGLANRKLLEETMNAEIRRAQIESAFLAVLFLDLDGFKAVNDTLGHDAGDQLLCEVANRLQEVTRSTDLVARLGGDEFTVLLTGIISQEDALAWADRILQAFQPPVDIDGNEVYIRSSIGISLFPIHGQDFEELIKSADNAMYHAKKQGKHQFRLYEGPMPEDVQA